MDERKNLSWFQPRLLSNPLCRVVLVEPLIPENTGNISRTCVATGSELHLVKPMGFELTASRVQRAGLDYWKDLGWWEHESFAAWQSAVPDPSRVFLIETQGEKSLYEAKFQEGDWLVFGKETSGLDSAVMKAYDALPNRPIYHIPMPGTTRSLNLSNSVAIAVFELLRQCRESHMPQRK